MYMGCDEVQTLEVVVLRPQTGIWEIISDQFSNCRLIVVEQNFIGKPGVSPALCGWSISFKNKRDVR